MIRISNRIWAGVVAVILLPVFALASDNNTSNSANGATNKASARDAGASSTATAPNPAPAVGMNSVTDPLLRLLVSKGVLSASDVSGLAAAPAAEMRDRLLLLLKDKGVLSADDLNALRAPAAGADAASGTTSANASSLAAAAKDQATGPPQPPQTPPPSGPIPAIAPIRVLQIDPPKREGVIPLISVGKNVRIQPYGLLKVSAVYDTSSPYGNDFPLPGFNGNINGPTAEPEFHVKARFFRFGSNFEWMDTPHLVITGKVEADFEGNFSVANNRNISSIRSNALQLRLAYMRIDYKPNDNNSVFALFGQDWTPFTSSTLPNLFETTGFGIGFGTLYERDPQFRVGFEHNFGGFKLGPEFAIVLPAYGNVPGTASAVTLQNQLGFGERQGVDSAAPEIQARIVGQFQLDHAPGVAPAQIIASGVHSNREEIVLAAGVPVGFTAAFPRGVTISSPRNALTGEIQFPTRWFTLVGKYYNGTDLRYYFGGQIFSAFNNTTGLTGTAVGTTVDGSGPAPVFGCTGGGLPPACLGGAAVVARQAPPRAWGGFLNLGLPLSRWANANPAGHNAGWALYFQYGLDQVLTKDVIAEGGGRVKGRLGTGTLFYKLNNFVSFALEESLYTTVAIPCTLASCGTVGQFPSFNGRPRREWNDFRTEFGPLFTF
jgi:hypothetical protein